MANEPPSGQVAELTVVLTPRCQSAVRGEPYLRPIRNAVTSRRHFGHSLAYGT